MASAFRREDRVHAPLTSPLEDINPALSHLKPRWPTSARKLLPFTLNKTRRQRDYTHGRHYSQRGCNDLMILNIYMHELPRPLTRDAQPGFGIGPAAQTPLYLFYPLAHPSDSRRTSDPNRHPALRFFGSGRHHQSNDLGLAMQYILDRHCLRPEVDSYSISLSVTHPPSSPSQLAVRWNEDYISLFVDPRPRSPRKFSLDCSEAEALTHYELVEKKDIPALTIYPKPMIILATDGMYRRRTYAPNKVWTTLQEENGSHGIKVFYNAGGAEGLGCYWFLFEHTSWNVVVSPASPDDTSNQLSTKAERLTGEKGRKPKLRRWESAQKKLTEAPGLVAHLYGVEHSEPLMEWDFRVGQLWVVESVRIELLDVVTAIVCAVVGLEEALAKHRQAEIKRRGWSGVLETELRARVDGRGFGC